GEDGLALPVEQGGGEEEELRGHLEVHLLHEADVGQVLIGDLRDRHLGDIQLVALDEVEQEIERAFEAVEADRDRHALVAGDQRVLPSETKKGGGPDSPGFGRTAVRDGPKPTS